MVGNTAEDPPSLPGRVFLLPRASPMRCILAVDDNDLFRQTLRTVFEADGYIVLEADNGFRVQQIVKHNRVDVLLTDILMPGADGVETIKAIRRTDCVLKIIAMSGSGAQGLYLKA